MIMLNSVYSGIAVFFWVLLYISFRRDRSRYRNCFLLFFATASTVIALSFLAGRFQKTFFIILLNIIFIALLSVPLFLVINGVLMIRREGHRLANLLSLLLGILIGAGELASFTAVILPEVAGSRWEIGGFLFRVSRLSMFFSVSVIYFSTVFVVFMLYCVFLQIIPWKRNFDYVIVLGAGLLQGERVSRLLSDRLDKAIEICNRNSVPPVLIPSGGKGADEKISEAEAMERYLLDKGIPADRIIKEDQSVSTFENLKNSKTIIDAQPGSRKTVLVTSNYHVYRALRYCRKVGLKCTGVGSHVALYYWPSAIIREFAAVHAEKKHFIFLIIGWVMCMIPLFLVYFAK